MNQQFFVRQLKQKKDFFVFNAFTQPTAFRSTFKGLAELIKLL